MSQPNSRCAELIDLTIEEGRIEVLLGESRRVKKNGKVVRIFVDAMEVGGSVSARNRKRKRLE